MKVIAVYPDKSKYTMTIEEVKEYMKNEPAQWQRYFFDALMDDRIAYGPIARYYLA